MQKTATDEEEMDFDSIFVELKDFGKFQIRVYVLICLSLMVYTALDLSYIFTSADLNYR